MQRFRAFFLVLGVCMIIVGISEVQVRGKAATVPQRLTLRQLEERGPGRNAHVEISEGFLCETAAPRAPARCSSTSVAAR